MIYCNHYQITMIKLMLLVIFFVGFAIQVLLSNLYTVLSGPWFDLTGSGNVTGVSGRNSHLACRVKNLANQTVSQQKVLFGVSLTKSNFSCVVSRFF